MKKDQESLKMKYWLDAELRVLHILFTAIMWQLTSGFWIHLLLFVYAIYCFLYAMVRTMYLLSIDPNYLKVPADKK